MSDDLARAYAFLERGDMAAERTEPSSVGTAFFDDKLPRRLDSNFLRVEREADGETVRAEAERLGRRAIFIPDSERGERLVPVFPGGGRRGQPPGGVGPPRAPRPPAGPGPGVGGGGAGASA